MLGNLVISLLFLTLGVPFTGCTEPSQRIYRFFGFLCDSRALPDMVQDLAFFWILTLDFHPFLLLYMLSKHFLRCEKWLSTGERSPAKCAVREERQKKKKKHLPEEQEENVKFRSVTPPDCAGSQSAVCHYGLYPHFLVGVAVYLPIVYLVVRYFVRLSRSCSRS